MVIAIVILAITVLLIILNILKRSKKKKSHNVLEVLKAIDSFQESNALFELQKKVMAPGTDLDMMREGVGEFGLEATNPVPTMTAMGSVSYLGRLRTLKGTKVQYDRIGPANASNIPYIVDTYKITADGETTTIYLCAYNKKNSARAPKGFRVASDEEIFEHFFGSR